VIDFGVGESMMAASVKDDAWGAGPAGRRNFPHPPSFWCLLRTRPAEDDLGKHPCDTRRGGVKILPPLKDRGQCYVTVNATPSDDLITAKRLTCSRNRFLRLPHRKPHAPHSQSSATQVALSCLGAYSPAPESAVSRDTRARRVGNGSTHLREMARRRVPAFSDWIQKCGSNHVAHCITSGPAGCC